MSKKENDKMKITQTYMFKKIEEKLDNSTNILNDMRLSPFLPLTKISRQTSTYKKFIDNKNILERKTPWGIIRIRNRLLTQTHKDILNAIYSLGLENRNKKTDEEKRITITFTRYELLKKLKLSDKGENYKMIDTILSEIKDTVIERISNDGKVSISYNILDEKGKLDDSYGITLSKVYSRMFLTEWTIDLSKRIDEMLAIDGKGSGAIKSIIDFFITQDANESKRYYIYLDKLLIAINYPIDTERQLTEIKTTINKYKDKLGNFGITFDKKEKRFTYIGAKDVKLYPPLKGL